MHYLLFYEKGPDYVVRELPVQADHLAHVLAAVERGELQLGGPLADPADGANVLLFRADSPDVVTRFAKEDPYVVAGVVARWHVRPWLTVVGRDAACPLAIAGNKPEAPGDVR
ncbi:MAG: hypothetical protein KF708_00530 [Pirellulales bacterium]|nr:hypothetical protein [Pirellulales bacterium]